MRFDHLQLGSLTSASGTRNHSIYYNSLSNPLIQLPVMRAPFGFSAWTGTYGVQHSLTLDVDSVEVCSKWKTLEDRLFSTSDRFTKMDKCSCLRKNGQQLRLEVEMVEDKFSGIIVDENCSQLSTSDIGNGDRLIALVMLAHVWTSKSNKCGLKAQVVQIKKMDGRPPVNTAPTQFCMVDDDDNSEASEGTASP